MALNERSKDIEALARMAVRLAGRDADEHLTLKLADVVAFDAVMWRYPDFLARAEAAYYALTTPKLTLPPSLDGREHLPAAGSKSRPDARRHQVTP